MLTQRKMLFAGIYATVVFGVVLVWMLCVSLWLPWHMLPGAAGGTRIVTAAGVLPSAALRTATGIDMTHVRYLAWEKSDQQRVAVVLPRLLQRRAALQALRDGGYQAEGYGPFLRAAATKQPPPSWPSLDRAVRRAVQSILLALKPPFPLFIATAGESSAPVPSNIHLIGAQHGGEIRVLVEGEGGQARSEEIDPSHLPQEPGVLLHGPSTLLTNLAAPQAAVWEEALGTRLGFRLHKPHFFDAAAQFQSFTVSITEQESGIAVTGSADEFPTLARAWVEEEERRTRPQSRAFRLPDGTFGFEQVPGNPEPAFSAEASSGCFAPLPGKTTLWLCANNERAALASSETRARTLIEQSPQPVSFFIAGTYLQPFSELLGCSAGDTAALCRITHIEGRGDAARLSVSAASPL